ncbi:hypothetical protein QQF64_018226 [Cirrhinus molitorella]|uniref:Secreted protein n=1 Tax=Cirrhinus molitorella TaxID=172907 RepID=A0ABR3LPY8_9TELE
MLNVSVIAAVLLGKSSLTLLMAQRRGKFHLSLSLFLSRTLTSRSHSSQTSLQSFITDFGAESQHMNLSREPITNRARGQKQRRSSWLRLFELARLRLLSLAEPRGCS